MNPLEAAILGFVQGLTEFLPVSSSGHLVLFQAMLGLEDEGIVFEVAVHAATLGAVLAFYRKRVFELLVGGLRFDAEAWRYAGKLALATLPAIAAAVLAGDALESLYERPRAVGAALLLTGALLLTTRRTLARAEAVEPGWVAVLVIGLAQALAIVPGVSRSGATVATALALGVAPRPAAEFAFLMSVPAILGAVVWKSPELLAASDAQLGPMLVGAGAALVSGLAALALFVRLLERRTFHRFAYYVFAVGLAVLVLTA